MNFPEFPFLHLGGHLNPEIAHRGLEWHQGALQSPMKSSVVFDLVLILYEAILDTDLYIRRKTLEFKLALKATLKCL